MSKYVASPEEMRSFAGNIDQVQSTIRTEIGKLDNLVQHIAGSWQGEAATQYRALQSRVNSAATAINTDLAWIADAMRSSGATYRDTERALAERMGEITRALG